MKITTTELYQKYQDLEIQANQKIKFCKKILEIIRISCFLLFSFILLFILTSINPNSDSIFNTANIPFLLFFSVIWLPILIYANIWILAVYIKKYLIIPYFVEWIKKMTQNIAFIVSNINKDITSTQSINDIINKNQEILLLILKVNNYNKIINLFTNIDISEIYKATILWSMNILSDLRSDLSIRLTEEQQILEWAKSEIEENIKGTTELESVSELQKIRIDKQIEQFEELQRVLVKV